MGHEATPSLPQLPPVDADKVVSVIMAVASPEYNFRTPGGIARESGLELNEVEIVLGGYGFLFRNPTVPAEDAGNYYTLASRKPDWRERYETVRRYLGRDFSKLADK